MSLYAFSIVVLTWHFLKFLEVIVLFCEKDKEKKKAIDHAASLTLRLVVTIPFIAHFLDWW